MDGSNLLTGGIDQLNEIKECLLERYGYQSKNETLLLEEEVLEKSIADLEQAIKEEIHKTIKKRRQEIEATFDQQEDKLQSRIKRIKEKREKSKSAKVSQRIEEETASLRQENAQLRLETKTLFRQKHVPSLCNSKLYYSLYFPSCFTDVLLAIATILITLLLIPCGIYFLLLPEEKILYLILTYVLTVLIFGGIYLLLGNRTKEKYSEELRKVKGLRGQIRVNKRKMDVIKRNIRKDRDESSYGLQDFDTEMAKLEQEKSEIALQKKETLAAFDNTTVSIITSEIEAKYISKLTTQREEYEKLKSSLSQAEERIKALTIKIASDYEPFLGRELMTVQKVDTLIQIIQEGNASTISEGVAFYKHSLEKEE